MSFQYDGGGIEELAHNVEAFLHELFNPNTGLRWEALEQLENRGK